MNYKDKFQDKKITIYNSHYLELLRNTADNYYDLGLLDPNCGLDADKPSVKNSKAKQKNGTRLNIKQSKFEHKDWDNEPIGPEFFKEIKRVSKHQIIWGVNYYDYDLRGGRIVWDKLNGEADQFGCEIAYCSMNQRTDIVYFMWAGMMQGVYIGKDIRKAIVQQGNKKLNEKRIHSTQKPVKLYEYLLMNYAKKGMKILDTHGGSMSSAIACNNLGFELDICEIDTKIYNDGVKRYKEQTSQQLIAYH